MTFMHFKRMMIYRIKSEIFIPETKGTSSNEYILEYLNILYNLQKLSLS